MKTCVMKNLNHSRKLAVWFFVAGMLLASADRAVRNPLIVKCRSAVVESAVFLPNCNRNCGHVYDLSVGKVPSSAACPFS